MNRQTECFIRRLRRDDNGAVSIVVALFLVAFLGLGALAVDGGDIIYAQSRLQATADMAALAGAVDINCTGCAKGTAITTAISYSAVSGNKNVESHFPVTMASGYPLLKCLSSTGISCVGQDDANAIVVKQQATVPLYLAQMFGVSSVQMSATATASARGAGAVPPLNVMLVLDTTDSMNNADTSGAYCGTAGHTKLDCALYGVQQLLSELQPTSDNVGLMVFPPLNTNTAKGGGGAPLSYDTDCSASTAPKVEAYNAASPVYQIVGLSNDYRASNTATSLDNSSTLVQATRFGTNCAGIDAIGGEGTYFAAAITAAQNALAASSKAGVQNVMIVLSDGGAGNGNGAPSSNQCHLAITNAQAATSAKTWVYSIAYSASTALSPNSNSCSDNETPKISSCTTMMDIASDSSKFYSDTTGGDAACTSSANPSALNLGTIFTQIGNSFGFTILIPNNTT